MAPPRCLQPAPSGPPRSPVDAHRNRRPAQAHLGKTRSVISTAATGATPPRGGCASADAAVTHGIGTPPLLAAGSPPNDAPPPPGKIAATARGIRPHRRHHRPGFAGEASGGGWMKEARGGGLGPAARSPPVSPRVGDAGVGWGFCCVNTLVLNKPRCNYSLRPELPIVGIVVSRHIFSSKYTHFYPFHPFM